MHLPPSPKTIGNTVTYDAHNLIPRGTPVQIVLDGQNYFLCITRAGKLILTK